jgi:DNA primase catalytic subunit
MRRYYSEHFPYDWVVWFLTAGGNFPLNQREFAFRWNDSVKRYETFKTLQDAQLYMDINGYPEDEVPGFTLPLRFGSAEALRSFLIEKTPQSIDIGPLFQDIAHMAEDRKDPYAPKLSQLSFDIDLKDYEGPCLCWKDKRICDPCWIQYLRPALVELLGFLKTFMQFECVIPIYSAGAGFHVFVIDPSVWDWDDVARLGLMKHLPPSVKYDHSIVLSHLIKLPFSPHKTNGTLSLPILDPETFLPSQWRIKIANVTSELMEKLLQ